MERTTRRKLLRAGGLAGVAGLAGGAGCLGILSGGGGDGSGGGNRTGTGSGTTAGTTAGTTTPGNNGTGNDGPAPVSAFRNWLPAPKALYGDSEYTFAYNDVATFRKHEGTLPSETVKRVKQVVKEPVSDLGVDPGSVERVIQVGTSGNVVVGGTFERSSLADSLSSSGYSKSESYQGFDIYAGGSNPQAVALGDGTATLCYESGTNKAVGVARLLIDTARGEATRYHEASESFGLISKPISGASRAGGTLMPAVSDPAPKKGRFKGMVGLGFGFTVGSDTTDLTMVIVFKNESAARTGPVETWTTEGLTGLLQYNDSTVTAEGRTVRIEGNVDTNKLDFLRGGNPGDRSGGKDEETLDRVVGR